MTPLGGSEIILVSTKASQDFGCDEAGANDGSTLALILARLDEKAH